MEQAIREQALLNDYQRDFPLVSEPFAQIGAELGCSGEEVLEHYQDLAENGALNRIGGVFNPGHVSVSTLAAMAVPEPQLETVARLVSDFAEVNHNYERTHHYNLWFVVHGNDPAHLESVLQQIEDQSGMPLLRLPMLKAYHLDLGFSIS